MSHIRGRNNCWIQCTRRSQVQVYSSTMKYIFRSISKYFWVFLNISSNSRNNGLNGCIKGSGCVGIKRELAGKQYRAGAVDEMSLRHERIPRLHQLPRPPSSVLRMVQNFQEYLELPGIAQNSLKNASYWKGKHSWLQKSFSSTLRRVSSDAVEQKIKGLCHTPEEV